MTIPHYPKTPWEYDGEPLEESTTITLESELEKIQKTGEHYKTKPAQLKAVRQYEAKIKQDKEQLEKRNHQKNYSGAKSFIKFAATKEELHDMKILIDLVIEWSEKVDDFDQMKRPERKERLFK